MLLLRKKQSQQNIQILYENDQFSYFVVPAPGMGVKLCIGECFYKTTPEVKRETHAATSDALSFLDFQDFSLDADNDFGQGDGYT